MQRRDGRLEAILEQERLTTKGSPRRLDYQPSAFGDAFSKIDVKPTNENRSVIETTNTKENVSVIEPTNATEKSSLPEM